MTTTEVAQRHDPFEVEESAIRRFADVIGAGDPIFRDREAALAAGYPNVVAPPMFAAVYQLPAAERAFVDPVLSINRKAILHGEQRFDWGTYVCGGDVITTHWFRPPPIEKGTSTFFSFELVSKNQVGAEVCRGIWTIVSPSGGWNAS